MIRIYKSAEPPALIAWKVGKNWQGNPPPWTALSPDASSAIIVTASCDQHQLCCYCTASIANGGRHIEHFEPQGPYPAMRFAWPNLLASCQGVQAADAPAPTNLVDTQRHCGHRKGNWFDPNLTINPLRPVGGLFRFSLDGRIMPEKALTESKYNAVQTTIDNLNLDAPSLRARRAKALGDAAKDAEQMSDREWRIAYLKSANDGSFNEFWPALKYNYDKHFRAVLASA